MIKAIVFDFDGVIVRQSEFSKQEVWEELFPLGTPEREEFSKAEKLYGGGRGGDRFDIIRYVYENVPKLRGTTLESIVADTECHFDETVQMRIVNEGILAHDKQTLVELSRSRSLYLNSATPVDALKRTLQNLGLEGVFKGVLGRPLSKVENFRRVAAEEDLSPAEILFVGDSEADVKAAKEFGCLFVGLGNDWNTWQEGGKEFPIVKDLAEVKKLVSDSA